MYSAYHAILKKIINISINYYCFCINTEIRLYVLPIVLNKTLVENWRVFWKEKTMSIKFNLDREESFFWQIVIILLLLNKSIYYGKNTWSHLPILLFTSHLNLECFELAVNVPANFVSYAPTFCNTLWKEL